MCFGLGALLALAHPGPLGARALVRGRSIAALFALLAVWPPLAFFVTKEPAWSLLFAVDPIGVAPALLVAGTLAAAALVALGYEAGVRVAVADPKTRLALPAFPIAFALLITALYGDRLLTLAPYSTWARGAPAPRLFESAFGAALVALDLLTAVGFAVAFRALAPAARADRLAAADDSG